MMLFHVPSNVSSFINCGSKSACDKQEVMGGFAAWYSCPVCAYRSVTLLKFGLREVGRVKVLSVFSESALGAPQWMSLISRTRTSSRWRTC